MLVVATELPNIYIYIAKLATFTCDIELYILTTTQNDVILITAVIYVKKPFSGQFLVPHLKILY